MAKRLVVCCDGTWNEPDQIRAGVAAPTNVAKLALGVETGGESQQILFYEPGVGTTADERISGGACGYGLSRNVRNCYRFLIQNYAPGDELFLFGFSRGAYTARSLVGLIHNSGILKVDDVDQVDAAFSLYRDRTSTTHPDTLAAQIFRAMYAHGDEEIHFIGVWDTVGALGIPPGLPGLEDMSKLIPHWERLWGFHDTQLSSRVRNAFHALAIDETREAFEPTLWTNVVQVPGQTVEQVWFAGVHTEVGGGSSDASLSDIALLWMVEKATGCGLVIRPGLLECGASNGAGGLVVPNYAGPIVDSRTGVFAFMRPYHRLRKLHDPTPDQRIASSVARRAGARELNYSPDGLEQYLDALDLAPVTEECPAAVPDAHTDADRAMSGAEV